MGLIYLDTCLIVYAFEQHPEFGQTAISKPGQFPAQQFAISPLVKMECPVAPLRQDNQALIDYYKKGLSAFTCLELGEEVFLRAASLRARHALKAPDALHLAAVLHHRCEQLWTNDNRLKKNCWPSLCSQRL